MHLQDNFSEYPPRQRAELICQDLKLPPEKLEKLITNLANYFEKLAYIEHHGDDDGEGGTKILVQ